MTLRFNKNRLKDRIEKETFNGYSLLDAPLAAARETFLDGMMVGKPIGEIFAAIIEDCIAFGEETFRDGDTLTVSTRHTNLTTLKQSIMEYAFDSIFNGGIKKAMGEMVPDAVAFGYKQAADASKYTSIESARDAVLVEAEANNGEVSDDAMEAFFIEAEKLIEADHLKVAMDYIKSVLAPEEGGRRVKMNTSAPYFVNFTRKYAMLIIG